MPKALCVLLIVGASGWGQQPKVRPDFKDFAVEKIYTGAPATPKLSRDRRSFRTMIREGTKSKVEFWRALHCSSLGLWIRMPHIRDHWNGV
jgi:hypothetical protein